MGFFLVALLSFIFFFSLGKVLFMENRRKKFFSKRQFLIRLLSNYRYTITVSIYNQKTKRTDILDKHQPTSTSLSKFNPSKTQLNFCNKFFFFKKKKIICTKTKLNKIIRKIYRSSHTFINLNEQMFSSNEKKN